MRASGNGLDLARPDIKINEAGQGRVVEVKRSLKTKVIQKPHASPMVFEALILGILRFNGFEAALDICHSMGKEGWGLSMKGLTPLLAECAERGDWQSGKQVWDHIQALQAKSRRMGRADRIHVQTFASMLQLCSACGQSELFHEILPEAMRRGHSHDQLLQTVRDRTRTFRPIHFPNALSRAREQAGNVETRRSRIPLSEASKDAQAHPLLPLGHMAPEHAGEEQKEQLVYKSPSNSLGDIDFQEDIEQLSNVARAEQNTADGTQTQSRSRPLPLRLPAVKFPHGIQLSREELSGEVTASPELDVYELAERPMSLHAY